MRNATGPGLRKRPIKFKGKPAVKAPASHRTPFISRREVGFVSLKPWLRGAGDARRAGAYPRERSRRLRECQGARDETGVKGLMGKGELQLRGKRN